MIVYKHGIENDDVLRRKIFQFQQKMEGKLLIAASDNPKIMRDKFGIVLEKESSTIRYLVFDKNIKNDKIDVFKNNRDQSANAYKYHYKFDGPEKISFLRDFVNGVESGKINVYDESSYLMYRYSTLLAGNDWKDDVIDSNKHVLVQFYKQMCPGCEALEPTYETFASEVQKVQSYWNKVKNGDLVYSVTEDNIVNRYNIKNPDKFIDLKICKFNVLNDNPHIKVTETPMIYFYKNDQKAQESTEKQFLRINLIKERLNLNEPDRIIWYLFKTIDQTLGGKK